MKVVGRLPKKTVHTNLKLNSKLQNLIGFVSHYTMLELIEEDTIFGVAELNRVTCIILVTPA